MTVGLIGGFWIELGDELAFGDDQDSVADCEHLRQIRGDQQYRQALVGEPRDHPMDLGLRGDVDAMRRLVEYQDLGFGREPLGEGDLLPVSAGEIGHELVDAGVLTS